VVKEVAQGGGGGGKCARMFFVLIFFVRRAHATQVLSPVRSVRRAHDRINPAPPAAPGTHPARLRFHIRRRALPCAGDRLPASSSPSSLPSELARGRRSPRGSPLRLFPIGPRRGRSLTGT